MFSGLASTARGPLKRNLDDFTRGNRMARFHFFAIDEHEAFINPGPDFVSGCVLNMVGEIDINPLLRLLRRDDDADFFELFGARCTLRCNIVGERHSRMKSPRNFLSGS